MKSTVQRPTAPATLWTARVIGALVVLFLLFDVFGKLAKPAAVVDGFAKASVPIALAPVIGIVLLVCVAVYVIPRTNVLGAILLTGYLGGATFTGLRAQLPAFSIVFPVIFGVLVWAPLYLTDERLRSLFPVRR